MPVEPSRPRAVLRDVVLGAYLLALVYGTLYPWSGWRSTGLAGIGFLFDPWPRYWTWFDLTVNVAIYLPLGALLAGRVPRGRVAPWVLVVAGASALSLLLESLQAFLPGRVPSRADWLANTAGALLGALAALRGLRAPDWPHARWARRSLDSADRAAGLALLTVWVLVQLHPQRPLFGHGDVVDAVLRAISTATAPDPSPGLSAPPEATLAAGLRAGLDYGLALEAFATAAAIVAIGMVVREIWPARAPRVQITVAVVLAALAARSLGAALQGGPAQAFGWLSAGAQGGLVTGTAALSMLASGRRRARLWVAVAAIATTALLTNVFPHDAYGATMLPRPERSAWRNFNGLLQALAAIWPIAAGLWCIRRVRALRPAELPSMERIR